MRKCESCKYYKEGCTHPEVERCMGKVLSEKILLVCPMEEEKEEEERRRKRICPSCGWLWSRGERGIPKSEPSLCEDCRKLVQEGWSWWKKEDQLEALRGETFLYLKLLRGVEVEEPEGGMDPEYVYFFRYRLVMKEGKEEGKVVLGFWETDYLEYSGFLIEPEEKLLKFPKHFLRILLDSLDWEWW